MKFVEFWKRVWKDILSPTKVELIVFYILFLFMLPTTIIWVILNLSFSVLQIICIVTSSLFVLYFGYTIYLLYPKVKTKLKNFIDKHNIVKIIVRNYDTKTIAFAICSLTVNVCYVILQFVLGALSNSAWYVTIASFYLILIILKLIVIYSSIRQKNETQTELKVYRNTGIFINFLTLALSAIIVLIYSTDMSFEYAGVMIYAVAAYTFYKITMSIIQLFKAKKQDNLYVQAIRNVNLVSALYSIFVLQVALLQAFSPELNKGFANGATGFGIALIILSISISMLVRYVKLSKKEN